MTNIVPYSTTNAYSLSDHYVAHTSSSLDKAYSLSQRGSRVIEDVTNSAANVVLCPVANPHQSTNFDVLRARGYWTGRAAFGALLSIPLIPFPIMRSILDRSRPEIFFIKSNAPIKTEAGKALHLMTSNTALGPEWLNGKSYLSKSIIRAQQIADKLTALDDKDLPDVFMGQEVWDESATKILVESLKTRYPYIIHSVGSNRLGRNSGLLMASRFPIVEAEFRPFPVSASEFCNKGALRANILVEGKNIAVIDLHNVSAEDTYNATLRSQHLNSVLEWIKSDADKFNAIFVAGDFNISRLNNHQQPMEEYEGIQNSFFSHFEDPYTTEHEENNKRISGQSRYLPLDVPSNANATEPEGSFYATDAASNWLTTPEDVGGISGCRYDFILRYKKEGETPKNDTAEIRRIFGKLSDHLALSAEMALELAEPLPLPLPLPEPMPLTMPVPVPLPVLSPIPLK